MALSLATGNYKYASGVCRFKDKDGNSIIANMTSARNKVEFQFRSGTGSWSGITCSGSGPGEMPFATGGTGQTCSTIAIKIKTP